MGILGINVHLLNLVSALNVNQLIGMYPEKGTKKMVSQASMENSEWVPKYIKGARKYLEGLNKQGRPKSQSRILLESLQVGDCKRIIHYDVVCRACDGVPPNPCSLTQSVIRQRHSLGWVLEYYHEANHIMVIRRLK